MWKRGCDVPKNANRKRDNQTGLSVSALPVYMLSAMVLRSFQDIGESWDSVIDEQHSVVVAVNPGEKHVDILL